MNAALHTHEMFDNDITVDVHINKRYTSFRIESTVYPIGTPKSTFILPSEFVLHMGGLTITEAEQFIEQRWSFEKDEKRQAFFDQYQEDTPAE